MQIASVGIDLGKITCHLVALDEHGSVVARSKFSRKQLLVMANLPSALVTSRPVPGRTASAQRCASKATRCACFRRSS